MVESLRQRVVAGVVDDLLALGALGPVDELLDGARRLARRVEIEEAADGVTSVLRRLERGADGGRRVVLLHLEGLDALEVRDAAVADAVLVALHGVDDGRGAGERLRRGGEV